jgi:hypothetical protein
MGIFTDLRTKKADYSVLKDVFLDAWHTYTVTVLGDMREVFERISIYDRYYSSFPNIHMPVAKDGLFDLRLNINEGVVEFVIRHKKPGVYPDNVIPIGHMALTSDPSTWAHDFELMIRKYLEEAVKRDL